MDAVELYRRCKAVRFHFTQKRFNLIKTPMIKINEETLRAKHEFYIYSSLSKLLLGNTSEIVSYLVANHVDKIGSFRDIEMIDHPVTCQKIYVDWVKRNQNLEKLFISDLTRIGKKYTWKDMVSQNSGGIPFTVDLCLNRMIYPETFACLFKALKLEKLYKEQGFEDDPVFSKIALKFEKYSKLIDIPKERIIMILKQGLIPEA